MRSPFAGVFVGGRAIGVVLVFVPVFVIGCAPAPMLAPLAEPAALVEMGRDAGRGNLLGLQPHLVPADYATAHRLRTKLGAWLDDAAMQGLVDDQTIVVLPEYVGAWLVAVHESDDVLAAATVGDAMTALALAHPLEFAAAVARAPATVEDTMAYAAFASKAGAMARAHVEVFGGLARDYGVVVTGASTLLPGAHVVDGELRVTDGAPLENVVVTFRPDGTLDGSIVRKAFPTAAEQPFVAAADVDALPVIDTPAGKLGVLICADSWFPRAYQVLVDKGAEMLAVPVFVSGEGSWTATWHGYSGHKAPQDVSADDVESIREDEAWRKYAMPARAPRAGFGKALLIPLRGTLWDLGDDGQPLTVNGPAREQIAPRDGPAIVSLWL